MENPRFVALRSHYGFDSFYCVPGKDGAHEKGEVEGEIGRFRRRHLPPVPHLPTLAALNEGMAAAGARDDARRIGVPGPRLSGATAARELGLLVPVPTRAFDASAALSCRVDAKARVCLRQSYYSIPARYAGRSLDVALGATTVRVLESGKVVAEHVQSLHKGSQDLVLDHYLEVLTRKPGALAGSSALATARANKTFTPTHEAYWKAARHGPGRPEGHRALIEALLLHRTLSAGAVLTGVDQTRAAGVFTADVVALAARTALQGAATVAIPPGACASWGTTRRGSTPRGPRPWPGMTSSWQAGWEHDTHHDHGPHAGHAGGHRTR